MVFKRVFFMVFITTSALGVAVAQETLSAAGHAQSGRGEPMAKAKAAMLVGLQCLRGPGRDHSFCFGGLPASTGINGGRGRVGYKATTRLFIKPMPEKLSPFHDNEPLPPKKKTPFGGMVGLEYSY